MQEIFYYQSICGILEIILENNQLVSLIKVNKKNNEIDSKRSETAVLIIKELDEYFNGTRKQFTISFNLKGTDFQKKVWSELLKIPYGETKTYKEIAKAIGNEKAARAVGNANNKNPICIIVPCHRVLGSNRKLIGYVGGIEMKETLLLLEQKNK